MIVWAIISYETNLDLTYCRYRVSAIYANEELAKEHLVKANEARDRQEAYHLSYAIYPFELRTSLP